MSVSSVDWWLDPLLDGKPVSTLDLISSPTHTLLILSGERPDPDRIRHHIARFASWSGLVHPVVVNGRGGDPQAVADPHLTAHRRYRALRGGLLLVRPDGYVA